VAVGSPDELDLGPPALPTFAPAKEVAGKGRGAEKKFDEGAMVGGASEMEGGGNTELDDGGAC